MSSSLPRTLSDGLILRHATPADAEKLAEFNAIMHSDDGPDQPDMFIRAWTMDLLTKPHPHFQPGDFMLVEEPNTGQIVSALCTISQIWTYEGIPFGVGRPELVATHPDHRRKGLIRTQMDVAHQWSLERGEIMQVITGIPWYYKQFGYEMALELSGGRTAFAPHIPKLKEGQAERFTFRPATEADIPFIMEVYSQTAKLHAIACHRDEAMWRYELSGRQADNQVRIQIEIIETPEGEPVGYLGHAPRLWGTAFAVNFLGVKGGKPDVSWLDLVPCILRFGKMTGERYAAQKEGDKWEGVYFTLGSSHPIYDLFPNALPRVRPSYAWYVRVADMTGFLQRIAPALEQRLAESPLSGYSGELALDFYRSGTRLHFDKGRITNVESWLPSTDQRGDVLFPDRSFLHVLCGRKTFDDLDQFMIDCFARKDEARALVNVLFPKKPADVWGIV